MQAPPSYQEEVCWFLACLPSLPSLPCLTLSVEESGRSSGKGGLPAQV